MITHVVKTGDCLSSIAVQYGFLWKTLWEHPLNAGLKAKRKNPNVLLPGDEVHIPEQQKKQEPRPVDQKHRFQLKGEKTAFQQRILLDGQPFKNQPAMMFVEGQPAAGSWATDSEGFVTKDGSRDIYLPGDTPAARLVVGRPCRQVTCDIGLGYLAPFDEIRGVQQRLHNLGFSPGPIDGIVGLLTKMAIREFRIFYKLPAGSHIDGALENKLRELHGS